MWEEHHQVRTVALNVGWRYVTLAIELLLGLLILPINTRYLGAADYGLWMLTASVAAYFPVLDLGYGGAMERFVAHYRARRDVNAINEIASTLMFVFSAIGLLAFAVMVGIAWNLGTLFNLNATQARTGAIVLLFVAAQFAVGLSLSIFGAVVNGFQRTFLNSIVGGTVAVAAGLVNIAVLASGGHLIELVGGLTAVRLAGTIAYWLNAYRVFPLLRVRPSLFRFERLREVTRFSVFMVIQDGANKVNYAADPIVIGALLTTGAVAVWTVAQRLTDVVLRLTNQLNEVLFPIVVDCNSTSRDDRLRDLLVQGTRLSLATTLPIAGALALLAEPVVIAWTGPEFSAAAAIVEILALVVLVRVGTATASIVLRGGGHHRLLAISNLVAAMVNVGLSIVLIRTHGLPGVAIATLIPVTIRAAIVLIPVACTRVGIPVTRFMAAAIWPTVWPAVIVLGGLAAVRADAAESFANIVLHCGAVGVVYVVLFLGVAIGRADRLRYMGKLRSLARRPVLRTA
jgi:O-antigen/teichoic acid export membrane protein